MYPRETTIFLAIIIGVLIFLALLVYFVFSIAAYHRKKMALAREQVSSDILFIENERSRIAFDLHDDVGNTLSAILLKLELAGGVDDRVAFGEVLGELGEVIEKVRQLSQNMLPGILQKKGLEAALRQLHLPCGISMDLSCHIPSLSAYTELHLYRIVQELVSNCCKHAGASSAAVSISTEGKKIKLRYTDNGVGFDRAQVRHHGKGAGLRNIYSRVDLLGGSLYLLTKPGKGVVWQAEIPFL